VAKGDSQQPTGEGAVRLYLMYLTDPDSLRDEARIKALTAEAEKAKDPIEKLRALAELERARAVDAGQFREGFVRNARAWADEQGITVSAFRELGVPDDALAEAGFDVGTRRGRGRGGARRAAASAGRQRAKAVPTEEIKREVLSLSGPFTLSEVMERAGGSPATVRKAVEDLVASGRVEKLGPAPEHSGRGRAPTQYAAVGG
jgi:Clp amino terminal domain, pathogenicity island component